MVEKMLPLLSDGLRKIVENIREKHPNCDIAEELLLADDLIIGYNDLNSILWNKSEETSAMRVIREKIESLINDEARMLSFRYNTFEISFLPKGRRPIYTENNTWDRENRQTAKPARLIQKILLREYKCKEFEDFSNWIKNEMVAAGEFILVEGEDITKYYNEDNYLECKGTLGNSCMRHSECEEYFEIYEDHAKMLICRKEDKILGRALVWELPKGTFMDRIYTCYDYLENQFLDYAEKQGWYHRVNNSLLSDGDFQEWYGPDTGYKTAKAISLTIRLNKKYEYMPYVDSFRYYNESNNTINTNPDDGDCYLSNTDGEYESGGSVYFTCERCGHQERGYSDDDAPDNFRWSEWDECWYCDECSVYCDGIDDYVSVDTPTEYAYSKYGTYCLYPKSYITDNDNFVEINDQWYHKNCGLITFNEETDSYILK